jgi:branched-chain amino acid transport system substrate-binding protein
LSEEKVSRRGFAKTAAAGIAGLAIGAGIGYGASTMIAPPTEVAKTLTLKETVTAGKPARGVPKEPLKLAFIGFFTGAAAALGEHTYDMVNMTADIINQGGGILGRKIETQRRDAGTTDVTVEALRRAVLEDECEIIVGDVGGSNANAITTHVEQLKVPWFLQCSTTKDMITTLDPNPTYLFRSGELNLAEPNVAAQIIAREFPDATKIGGINPDYVYGHEAMGYTMKALNKLAPHMESTVETWPPLFGSDFSSQITTVMDAKPDVVVSACWGGDFLTLAKQGSALGLFESTNVVSIVGSILINECTKDIVPPGVWMLQRDYYFLYPDHNISPMNKWFNEEYYRRHQRVPEFDGMQVFSAIFAYKQAIERCYERSGSYPELEEVCKEIQNSQVVAPVGHRTITDCGQFINPLPYGRTMHSDDYPMAIIDPETFGVVDPALAYNPKSIPPILEYERRTGMVFEDWIDSW